MNMHMMNRPGNVHFLARLDSRNDFGPTEKAVVRIGIGMLSSAST